MSKKITSVVLLMLLLFVLGISNIAIAQNYACKDPIMKQQTLQDIVNQWYLDKEKENFAFTEKMAATVRNMSVEAKEVSDFLSVGIYETVLYEHYTDEINCTVDRRKAIKLEEERNVIHSTFGNRARTFFRRLPSIAQNAKDRATIENYSGCYFNDIEPSLKKMYKQHPSRRSCAR
jgi:hypothetical protein